MTEWDEVRQVPVKDCGESKATEKSLKHKRDTFKIDNPGLTAPGANFKYPWKPGQYEKIFRKGKEK